MSARQIIHKKLENKLKKNLQMESNTKGAYNFNFNLITYSSSHIKRSGARSHR